MNPDKKPATQMHFVVIFNRNITLFTLIVLPILCGLGIWQLSRAAEKHQLQESYAQLQVQAPISFITKNIQKLSDYQRVFAQGFFDNDHTWLLDNKQRRGQVGYEVISPFVLEDNTTILVNRGWVAAGNTREDLPEIAPVNGAVTLFAELASVTKHPLLNAKSEQQGWPKVVMTIELETMAQQLGDDLLPGYLRLDENSPGAFFTAWQPFNVSASKHIGYAVQWFAMACALIVWFFCTSTNVIQYWRSRSRNT